MSKKTKGLSIQAEDAVERPASPAILGTYDGECADANITNLNGLDITREVWENVFASEEYKKAIEHGWYIGFLGHPQEDAECQDFRRACIVMTEGRINDNGKVYGKFNLIDTPVGQIVKAFQDAGVIFGISVRGAGDIINNSVDPETFVFRGFDLVTFPAFPESIPKFTAIAASTDAAQRQKYQAVCAAVKNNMNSLDTVESVETVQACFAKQSEEYQALEDHKAKLQANKAVENEEAKMVETIPKDKIPILGEDEYVDPRVDSMTKMYLELKDKYDNLCLDHAGVQASYKAFRKDSERRTASIERICSAQMNDYRELIEAKSNEVEKLQRVIANKTHNMERIQGSVSAKSRQISDLTVENHNLKSQLSKVQASLEASRKENNRLKEANLKYNTKVEAAQDALDDKESIIASLKAQLDETVTQHAREQKKSANRDDTIERLKSRVEAAESLTQEYRDAYAQLYANAIGVQLPDLSVTASTDVSSLRDMIRCNVSLPMKPDFLSPTQEIDPSDFDMADYDEDDTTLVTL